MVQIVKGRADFFKRKEVYVYVVCEVSLCVDKRRNKVRVLIFIHTLFNDLQNTHNQKVNSQKLKNVQTLRKKK